MNKVQIQPARRALEGVARVPHSKPHMQRAILLSLLTNGPSIIVHPAWSSEAKSLFDAAQQFGLTLLQHDSSKLALSGVGKSLGPRTQVLSAVGSAFMFRTIAALACLSHEETILEGNASMLARPIVKYLGYIRDLGARMDDVSDDSHLRVRIRGSRHLGGETTVDTRHSSQVLTSLLIISPLAARPVTIHTEEAELVGEGYVDLTLDMMKEQGAEVEKRSASYVIPPAAYRSQVHHIASDFTALSYLAGAVATARDGQITISDFYPSTLSSEKDFFETLGALGILTSYDPVARTLHIRRGSPASSRVEIDGRNIPTVVPTLAAIAPFVEAEVILRNAAHVNNHKCRRVEVMIQELTRMGCRITPHYDGSGHMDGFITKGRQEPVGDIDVKSHGDHRIFMSLATASLGARAPTWIEGVQYLEASFPDFLGALERIGARGGPPPAVVDNSPSVITQ